jgi:sulfide:quinone oxidoreductase
MVQSSDPQLRLLIAGGGVAALEALLATRALADRRVSIDLLAPEPELTLRPRAVLVPFRLGEHRRYPLEAIAHAHDAVHHRDALESVDPAAHTARTAGGRELGYDVLLVATGARAVPVLPGAVTFSDERPESFARVLDQARAGEVTRLGFVVPPRTTWTLPLYELALMTSYEARALDAPRLRLTLITPEEEPLGVFGRRAADTVRGLLRERAIELRTGSYAEEVTDGRTGKGSVVLLRPGGEQLSFDRIVSLPHLAGPSIEGLPADEAGFIPVDQHGHILGAEDCFAAGDVTSFPVKQGGLATQQADAAAEAIAARAGAAVEPREFRPILRGLLLTSAEPQYLRAAISGGQGETSIASSHVLWWPSTKVAGRFLASYLAKLDASTESAIDPGTRATIPVDVELHDI